MSSSRNSLGNEVRASCILIHWEMSSSRNMPKMLMHAPYILIHWEMSSSRKKKEASVTTSWNFNPLGNEL